MIVIKSKNDNLLNLLLRSNLIPLATTKANNPFIKILSIGILLLG